MKEYNREKKRWEDPETIKLSKQGKRELCKGKRPHDFKLVLPEWIERKVWQATEETIQAYYQSEARVDEFLRNEERILRTKGIGKRVRFFGGLTKYYRCSVCGKKDSEKIK